MKNIEVEVTGISPLLQHRFPMPENGEAKSRQEKQRTAKRMNVEQSLYRLPNGTIYQPAIHFISAMKKSGAKFQVPGSGKLTFKTLSAAARSSSRREAIPAQKFRHTKLIGVRSLCRQQKAASSESVRSLITGVYVFKSSSMSQKLARRKLRKFSAIAANASVSAIFAPKKADRSVGLW